MYSLGARHEYINLVLAVVNTAVLSILLLSAEPKATPPLPTVVVSLFKFNDFI